MRAGGCEVSTSTVERALRRRGSLLPRGYRADRKSWAVLRREVFHDPPTQRNRVWQTVSASSRAPVADLDDLRVDRGLAEVIGPGGEPVGLATAPIAVVSDNGPCFRGEIFKAAFTGPDPLPRHLRTRVRFPQNNGAIERFFGTLRYERPGHGSPPLPHPRQHHAPTPGTRRSDTKTAHLELDRAENAG